MSVIPFPPPPGGGEPPKDALRLPRFEDHSITAEQLATLEMMGLTPADAIGEHMVSYYVDPDAGTTEAPSIARPHILQRFHPIVMHRSRRRAIMANGDVLSLSEPE